MATAKSGSNTNSKTSKNMRSKVRNTTGERFTGKNELAESLLVSAGFIPRISARGNARITFSGVKHGTGKDFNTREEVPKLTLAFSCLDETGKAPQTIGIICDYTHSQVNKLGEILDLMGYEPTKKVTVIDENDEFGVETERDVSQLFDFLRSKTGCAYTCTLYHKGVWDWAKQEYKRDEKGEIILKKLWDIKPDSLKPIMEADGVTQINDWAEVSEEEFLNPNIHHSDSDSGE